jgi:protein-S-isoprenylcysteine O-methyltransferase Ste14
LPLVRNYLLHLVKSGFLFYHNKQKQNEMSQLKTQAPKSVTVIVSVVLVLLGLFGAVLSPAIAENGDWFLLAGFVLLLLGTFVKGI